MHGHVQVFISIGSDSMKPDVADKWINELRSGEYKQATGQLRKCGSHWEEDPMDSSFCCLGVLCDVFLKEHKGQDDAHWWGLRWDRGTVCMGEEYSLPRAVREWAGMKTDNGKLPFVPEGGDCLTDMNDNGMSFTEIADVIERNVDAL
jgi:hypothetical protein